MGGGKELKGTLGKGALRRFGGNWTFDGKYGSTPYISRGGAPAIIRRYEYISKVLNICLLIG
jgi:hypothetical protein